MKRIKGIINSGEYKGKGFEINFGEYIRDIVIKFGEENVEGKITKLKIEADPSKSDVVEISLEMVDI